MYNIQKLEQNKKYMKLRRELFDQYIKANQNDIKVQKEYIPIEKIAEYWGKTDGERGKLYDKFEEIIEFLINEYKEARK